MIAGRERMVAVQYLPSLFSYLPAFLTARGTTPIMVRNSRSLSVDEKLGVGPFVRFR